ncbi:MAG: short-chain dehydrogenase [Candidatus Cloacimonadota bacterium]|nr:MAG: short-chain dehydrogenase [Candidatus Cloacimonadota bacterium]
MDITSILSKDLYKDKVVFITGGGSGINLGVAKVFAKLGAKLALCGRTFEKLEGAKKELEELGAEVFIQACDVRDFEGLTSFLKNMKEALGALDILVCGAAGNFLCPANKMSENAFKTVIDIDLMGTFNASRAAFSQLKETKGSMIYISAGQAFIPYFAQCHVGAAKAGIDNLMQNLALEWGSYGIRVNSIVPGPIEGTEGMARLAPGEVGKKLRKMIPAGRMGTKDDIGAAAAFLCSPLASYITGTVLKVDGGMNLAGSGLFTALVSEVMASSSKK